MSTRENLRFGGPRPMWLRSLAGILAFALMAGNDSVAVEASAAGPATRRGKLECSPSKLARHDVLTLKFGMPHAAELAVIRPDRAYFFIAQRRLVGGPVASGMPSELFAGLAETKIVPAQFSARMWHVKATMPEPVFTAPGTYKFVMADRLESEDTEIQQVCEVTLID